MRRIYLVAFILLLSFTAFSQHLTDEQQVLLKAIRITTKRDTIAYIDRIRVSGVDKLQDYINSTNATTRNEDNEKNTLFLTKSEQQYLIKQLSLKNIMYWNDSLFDASVKIKEDGLWSYLRAADSTFRKKMDIALAAKDTALIRKYRKEGRPFAFALGKPLFIRHNTICLVNTAALCGPNCGSNEMSFYRKENGEWKKWILVTAGEY